MIAVAEISVTGKAVSQYCGYEILQPLRRV